MNVTYGLDTANPQIMPAKTLLTMAAENGAKALMQDDLGKVEVGCKADLIGIDLDQPHMMATGNLVNTLVESAAGQDVKHSVIGGKLVMKNRELLTIDEEKLMYEIEKIMGDHNFFAKAESWCGR